MSEEEYPRAKDVRLPEVSQEHLSRISLFLEIEGFSGVLRRLLGSTKRLMETPEARIYFEELINAERKLKAPRGNSKRVPGRFDDQFTEKFAKVGLEFNANSFGESVKRVLRFWNSVLDSEPEQDGPILTKIFTREGKNDLEIWFFF